MFDGFYRCVSEVFKGGLRGMFQEVYQGYYKGLHALGINAKVERDRQMDKHYDKVHKCRFF